MKEGENNFLDKNPIFDYAQHEMFDYSVRPESVELVEKIKNKEITAYIAPNTAFALYNFLRYKLSRPEYKGGKDMDFEVAEKKSKKFCSELFSEGSFKIVNSTIEDVTCSPSDERFEDAEDAFQFYCAKRIDALIITWNLNNYMEPKALPEEGLGGFHTQKISGGLESRMSYKPKPSKSQL